LFVALSASRSGVWAATYFYGLLVPHAFTFPCDGQAMGRGFDFLAEAEAAMKMAAAAACEHDRLRWVHVAQVWKDLDRCAAQLVSIAPKPHAGQSSRLA
jgi:hypothetical protein